jgi:shikimate kinase
VIVVVITGPIASGKSTLGRAIAAELASRGLDSAVVDLDLVYEMLDPSGGPKTDEARWMEARQLVGKIVAGLAGRRSAVVVEGEFGTDVQRADLCNELPSDWRASFVTLTVDFEEAWRRAVADSTRGISKDRDFLAAHYRALGNAKPADGDLVLDTGDLSVSRAARSVADWLLRASK